MKREYAFAYNINGTKLSGIITMTNPPTLVCYCDKENSKLILDALNTPLPPAEGARKVQWSGYGELGNISQKPLQPTAEGAKEILEKHLNLQFKDTPEDWTVALIQFNQEKFIAAMQEFATLHAQRIAEKMVEERSEFIKKAVIRFFYTEVDLNFCTREYRDRVEWYFNTYQHEIFKLPKTSLDNLKTRER